MVPPERIFDCSSMLIYRPRKDERLSWPSWLTRSGRFTHITCHSSDAGRAQDRESSPAKDRGSSSTNVPHHQLMMTDKSAAGCVILLKFGMLVYYGPRNKSQNEWRDVQQSQAAMHPNARPSEHRKFFSAELFYTGPSLFQTAQPPPITFTLYAMGSLVGRTNRHLPNSFHNFYREWVKKLAKWSRYSTTLASEPPSFRI